MSAPAATYDAPTADADTPSSDGSYGSRSSDGASGSARGKNWLEWTITGLGAVLVLVLFGFLIYEWATATGAPAELRITLGEPRADSSFVEIPVTVENVGGKVAVGATIEVCAAPERCSELLFDYVPFESTVTGSVGFRGPLALDPTTRVVSYRNP